MSVSAKEIASLEAELAAAKRELKIEASVERVRTKALAMRKSEEILEVAAVLKNEMKDLGLQGILACTINIRQADGTYHVTEIAGLNEEEWTDLPVSFFYDPADIHPDLHIHDVLKIESYTVLHLDEEAVRLAARETAKYDPDYAEAWNDHLDTGVVSEAWVAVFPLEVGQLSFDFDREPTGESEQFISRLAGAFDLVLTRFLDLGKAEAQAREAKIEASLERLRGRAMAMQKPDDIGEVSILLFDELEGLDMKSLRSGIGFPSDDGKTYEFRAATRTDDGSTTLVSGREAIDVHPLIRECYDYREKGGSHMVRVLEGDDLLEYYHAVFDTMPLSDWKERMKAGSTARECFSSFAFSDGWIYSFTEDPMTDAEIDILLRFTKVFELAYKRYHDLTKAEEDYKALLEEKAKTEQALTDLQATQQQLIEQEKLASLGALTAGIAHEIKNPLNFVNNFAEVSSELMDELADAVSKGNWEEVKSLLVDLKNNAGQIAKHGRRADSIVRSMMQHARGGVSTEEEVEFNEYIDEYAGLAWHGMRARDHGFQVDMHKEFDGDIGKATLQPQEFGRVLLNLFNNAFDAVKGVENATVTVRTARTPDGIRLTVSDNGHGVPDDIREKIFEPFFTTKATGEGTGLGLSLSYDIVTKGHRGTMTVGSSTAGGAEFVIQIPDGKA